MAKIISIGTEVPPYQHTQQNILRFMEGAYSAGEKEIRVLSYLYNHSGIERRHSVIADYTLPIEEWRFFPKAKDLEPFPGIDKRMDWYKTHAMPLSLRAANKCVEGTISKERITHLITVSCTGMMAPGLELQLMEAMELPPDTTRTAINFMGCYAAVHGLKMASDIVTAEPKAIVLLVCTELCTLHFQKTYTPDTMTAPLLFADGSAAALICADEYPADGIRLRSFYSEILKDAKNSMTWNVSSSGFVMTLDSDVPDIFRSDMGPLKKRAVAKAGLHEEDVRYYCIHPGGKRILEAIGKGLSISNEDLCPSYEVLRDYGNMSSATILFVLKNMWLHILKDKGAHIFSAAFGPGLTMESAIMTVV